MNDKKQSWEQSSVVNAIRLIKGILLIVFIGSTIWLWFIEPTFGSIIGLIEAMLVLLEVIEKLNSKK